ncbi:ArsR/SmtB family transcription factor [Streptomyces sp. WI04-05B]|uniref:ArsR/SmtB family transcription factor n=1 Tax=Streptomyces TaxID=1883 RepID=UPI0029BD8F9B|nr:MULTISPECIES: winged helix-turn-helix domain-containing protein [unclassified Streptomyces]MDX2548762.1 winged helix-turn-helix domain-containing protein [Streptomyces sp. WI04-05B]MDX2590588.1 winged helix-turn-helix domain-containing protein [Streptomyces sp. WI04-05A]MDX3745719.1 winged helix-turn-helix domain-containing protein [Streptomyces sp. AK08-02]
MTFRIEFSQRDLGRLAIGRPVHLPVSEAVMSLQVLRRGDRAMRFQAWQEAIRTRGIQPGAVLKALVPADGWVPDFLTPVDRAWPEAGAFDAIRATPRLRVRRELARLSGHHPLPDWGGRLAEAGDPQLDVLVDDLEAYYDAAVRSFAPAIRTVLDADRALRAETLASKGVDAFLHTLHPSVTWKPPFLVLPSRHESTFRLQGRGLIISGHFFCWPSPRVQLNDCDTPVLVHPASWDPAHHSAPGRGSLDTRIDRGLAAALGRTRARVLLALAQAPHSSTAELARQLDISAASASEHATVLRQAGLTDSRRQQRTVRHSLTPLGNDLLNHPRHPITRLSAH